MLIKNKIIKHFRRLLLGTAVSAIVLLPSSCSDDLLDKSGEIHPNEDGTFGPITLIVPIDAEVNDTKTRGTFETSNFELTSSWAAIFDAQTGYLVAMTDTLYNFDDGNYGADTGHGNSNNNVGSKYEIAFRNFIFNDDNTEVYIAGVANYENISAIDANGNEMDLIDALKNVRSIIDYKNIAVNTASAEQALDGKNRPVIAGFWGNSHGNFTVDLSGKVHTNNSSESKVELYDQSTYRITQSNIDAIAAGKIHLRRLYSHLNVNVTVNTSSDFTFRNPRVKVYNVPQYTFIQEHKTVENANQYKNESWPAATHTAADIFGTNLDIPELSLDNPIYNNTNDAAFLMNEADKFSVSQSGNQMHINFGYWHYETKHWGLASVTSQNDRERMYGNSGVYSSLCPSEEIDFNNEAPYFVITAEVSNGTFSGTADFIIHEGNCCQANGDLATDAAIAARDFSTFRNVNYTYNVEINGIDNIITKVTAEDLSGDFYHGTGGEFWSTEVKKIKVAKGGTSYNLRIPKGKLIWCISENNEAPYGMAMDEEWGYKSWYPMYPSDVDTSKEYGDFYNGITLNGKHLGEIDSFNQETACTLSFESNSANNGLLYLCGIYTSPDGLVDYYTVYCFDQDGMMLDTPNLSMPNAPAGNLVLGIHDHTISWKEIEGADSYTVTLGANSLGGGYSVTLRPGETTKDAGGLDVTLKRSNDGTLSYTMRYAKSQNALLSLVDDNASIQATATFTVVARNSATGAKSDPATISKTVVNPVWDFNSSAWQSSINGILSGTSIPVNASTYLNGMTLYAGSSAMTYQKYGNYFAVMTGGAGSTSRRVFMFHAFANGKINTWTSSNGGTQTDERYVVVAQQNESGGSTVFTATDKRANASSSGTQTQSQDIPIDPVSPLSFGENNVWIYGNASFVFYKIKFTPQDR